MLSSGDCLRKEAWKRKLAAGVKIQPFKTLYKYFCLTLQPFASTCAQLDKYVHTGGDSAGGNMSAVTCLRARDRQESGYKGPKIAMQLLLYPETALPFTTKAGSENCTGLYLETSGVLLFAWNMLPQGQVSYS